MVPDYMVLPSNRSMKRGLEESKMSLLGKLMDTMRLSSEDDEDDYYLDDDFEDEAPRKRTFFQREIIQNRKMSQMLRDKPRFLGSFKPESSSNETKYGSDHDQTNFHG